MCFWLGVGDSKRREQGIDNQNERRKRETCSMALFFTGSVVIFLFFVFFSPPTKKKIFLAWSGERIGRNESIRVLLTVIYLISSA